MSGEIPVPLGFAIIAIVIFIVWQIYQRKIIRQLFVGIDAVGVG